MMGLDTKNFEEMLQLKGFVKSTGYVPTLENHDPDKKIMSVKDMVSALDSFIETM